MIRASDKSTKGAKSMYVIFNHTLTASQTEDARSILGVSRFISLPDDLQNVWSSIPPDLQKLEGYLDPLRNWLIDHAKKGDFVLIQGDFGATYLMVKFCYKKGLIPVYSTTKRVDDEEIVGSDGSVRRLRQFRHVRFRVYGD